MWLMSARSNLGEQKNSSKTLGTTEQLLISQADLLDGGADRSLASLFYASGSLKAKH